MDIESLITSLENAENDNKKFALLLILSELIKSNKLDESIKTNKSVNKRLLASIGSHFLARLLSTKQLVENSSILYKSVSLSILTQFLDYPDLITDPVILTKIDSIFDILKSDLDLDSGLKNLKLDTFKYVYELSKICPDFLNQNGLIGILINDVILNPKFSSKELNVIYDFNSDTEDDNFALISCKIILNLLKEINEANKNDQDFPIAKRIDKIEDDFRNFLETTFKNQTEFKFILINYLNYFLSDETSAQQFILQSQNLNDLTSKLVFEILNDLFKSKLKQPITQLGFVLLNNFVKLYDFELIYMKNRNFFYLIIHLMCIQIGVCIQQCYQSGQENQVFVDNDLINKMSVYCSLLEQVIIILSTASPFDTGDEEDDESEGENENEKTSSGADSYEPEFKKVIKIVVEVLETIILFIKDTLVDDYSKLDPNSTILLVSSIRIVVCWMSHESLLEDEIIELMPRIMKFSDYLKDSMFKINVYKFLAPGIDRVLIDKSNKLDTKLKKSKLKEDLVKFEFEKSELSEQIESLQSMLDTCHKNIDPSE